MKPIDTDSLTKKIVLGVEETFKTMFHLTAKEVHTGRFLQQQLQSDVSGILTINQPEIAGLLVISFPKPTILGMLSKFYGSKLNDIDMTVGRSVGEITNIVYGVAKKILNEEGHELVASIPSIIVGNQHFVFTNYTGEITVMDFATDCGTFQVYTCIKKGTGAALKKPA